MCGDTHVYIYIYGYVCIYIQVQSIYCTVDRFCIALHIYKFIYMNVSVSVCSSIEWLTLECFYYYICICIYICIHHLCLCLCFVFGISNKSFKRPQKIKSSCKYSMNYFSVSGKWQNVCNAYKKYTLNKYIHFVYFYMYILYIYYIFRPIICGIVVGLKIHLFACHKLNAMNIIIKGCPLFFLN